MNGIHDMGGMHSYFGPIEHDVGGDEKIFKYEWEKHVRALALVVIFSQRRFSTEALRHGIESQPPLDYLRSSYWERWLTTLENLLLADGLVTEQELASGHSAGEPLTDPTSAVGRWAPEYHTDRLPRFRAGDVVRAVNRHPAGHTREPRYIRGRLGVVVRHVGAEPLAEEAARHLCVPQNLYNVRFESRELWGPDSPGNDAVYLDLFEDYLEPA